MPAPTTQKAPARPAKPEQYRAPTHPELVEQVLSHWQAHLPSMYARLVKSGELNDLARSLAASTQDHAQILIKRQGVNPMEAWSDATREILLQTGQSSLD